MQFEQNMPMSREDNNISNNFGPYEDEKSTPEVQNIEKDYRDLVGKSLDIRSHARVTYTP